MVRIEQDPAAAAQRRLLHGIDIITRKREARRMIAIWGLDEAPFSQGMSPIEHPLLGPLLRAGIRCRLLGSMNAVDSAQNELVEWHAQHEATLDGADALILLDANLSEPLPSPEALIARMNLAVVFDEGAHYDPQTLKQAGVRRYKPKHEIIDTRDSAGRPTIVFPHRGAKKTLTPSGATRSMMELAGGLSRRGFRVIVALLRDGESGSVMSGHYWESQGVWRDYAGACGVESVTLDVPYMGKDQPNNVSQLALIKRYRTAWQAFVEAFDVQAVHTNDAATHGTVAVCCETLAVKHIWHERGRFRHYLTLETLERRSDLVLSVSEFVRDLAPPGLQQRVEVIPNPIGVRPSLERETARAQLRERLELAPDARLIAMVGNDNPRKRWDLFFDAARRLIARCRERSLAPPTFVAFGDGANTVQALKADWHASESDKSLVVARGYTQTLADEMAGLDLIVQTADEEPLGRVLIEATLLGVPVVAADAGGHTEVLRTVPEHLFDADDVNAVVEALWAFLERPQPFYDRTVEARAEFESTYAIESHVSRVMKAYARVGLTPVDMPAPGTGGAVKS